MFEANLREVGGRVRGARALADVRAVAEHHRIQASPGYDAAAAWLVAALEAEGLTVERDEAPGDGRTRYFGMPMPEGWACDSARATLVGGAGPEPLADFAREPLSLIQRSESANGRYPLVALEDGTRAADYDGLDVRGKVVLTSGAVGRVHALAVRERGAAGLVSDGRRLVPPVRTAEHDRDSLAYTSFWWQGDEPRGWGLVVSPARGEALRARLAAGEALAVEVAIATRRYAARIPLVSALVPGPWPGEVLVTAHLCHPRPGANDNGSGVAAALEAARAVGSLLHDGRLPAGRRSIRFLWMPEFTGTYAWIGRDPARAARTVAALNLDMVGERQDDCGSTQLIERAPHFAGHFADELLARIRHAAQEWVETYAGPGHYSMVRAAEVPYSGGSDHAVWLDPAIGVPCPMLIQWPDRYYHSNLDTPERCDPDSLAHAARVAATYAVTIACADAAAVRQLLAQGARAARRRLLLALDAAEPAAAARAERLRGLLALASLQRLAPGDASGPSALETDLALAAEELEGFWESEIEPALGRPAVSRRPAGHPRVPVRRPALALLPMRTLLEAWPALDAQEQAAFVEFEESWPSGAPELAWFACDGVRTIDDITGALLDEGVAIDAARVETFFRWTERLGLSRWRDSR